MRSSKSGKNCVVNEKYTGKTFTQYFISQVNGLMRYKKMKKYEFRLTDGKVKLID